jgi:AraC family transcriptional regulator, ethanolamine operon transcriptional activator
MSLIQLVQHARSNNHSAPPALREEQQQRRPSRADLVGRVVVFLRDNIGEPVTVAALSRMAGVSERTLRAAFHDVLGLSPKRYAIAQRLHAAREALDAADPHTTTVTDIAMAYGFFELGRFAGRYRDAFGEAPSRTLRHVAESRPEQAA